MRSVVIGVGSNLGSREASIRVARDLVDSHPRMRVIRASSLYQTAPVGPPQPDFLNAAFLIETDLAPESILEVLLAIESRLGRRRAHAERWSARSLDLDLLHDDDGAFRSATLEVPHVELLRRRFALSPLLEIAPALRDKYGASLDELGGPLSPWGREAIVRDDHRRAERVVEAESEVDAVALVVSSGLALPRSMQTEERTIDSSASAFAATLETLRRRGFVTHRATASHCSNTQWVVRFHGETRGVAPALHVRLRTTSGENRMHAARATFESTVP